MSKKPKIVETVKEEELKEPTWVDRFPWEIVTAIFVLACIGFIIFLYAQSLGWTEGDATRLQV